MKTVALQAGIDSVEVSITIVYIIHGVRGTQVFDCLKVHLVRQLELEHSTMCLRCRRAAFQSLTCMYVSLLEGVGCTRVTHPCMTSLEICE